MTELPADGADESAEVPAAGPTANPSRVNEGFRWRGALLVAALATLALWLVADFFDPDRLHIHGLRSRLNDQAGYITTARYLAETGELRSGLVLPVFADNPASRVYMPGHYAVLASSYKLFGYSVQSSLLPSQIAFVLTAVAVFLIGARRYGSLAGAAAALLTILFPPNLLFAFTAMAENSFLAVGTCGFLLFCLLGRRARRWSVPLLVAASFLFRETGALWVLPFALVTLYESGSSRLRETGVMVLATVALVFLVNGWQLSTGKEAPPLTWLTGSGFNYGDAFADSSALDGLGLGEFLGLVLENASRNMENLQVRVLFGPSGFERVSVLTLMFLVSATALAGLARLKRDPLPLGAVGMALATWALAFGLYDVVGLKLLRSSLFFVPLCLIALTGTALRGADRGSRGGRVAVPLILLGAVLVGWSWTLPICRQAGEDFVAGDAEADAALDYMEEVGHDPSKLLVAPWLLGLEYSVVHYPTRYSFPPENMATLKLLAENYSIGTLILSRNKLAAFPRQGLEKLGLVPVGQIGGTRSAPRHLVFQARP